MSKLHPLVAYCLGSTHGKEKGQRRNPRRGPSGVGRRTDTHLDRHGWVELTRARRDKSLTNAGPQACYGSHSNDTNVTFHFNRVAGIHSQVKVAGRRDLLPRHGHAGGRRAQCSHLIAIYTRAPRSSNCTVVRPCPGGKAPSGHVCTT